MMILFTYGLNMTPPRFCPSCRFIGRAVVLDNKLVFSGSNAYWGHQGYASLRYSSGDKAYGVAYQIDPKDLSAMDTSESLGLIGTDTIIKVPVMIRLLDSGDILKSDTYVQARPFPREPSVEYYSRLRSQYMKYEYPLDALSLALVESR